MLCGAMWYSVRGHAGDRTEGHLMRVTGGRNKAVDENKTTTSRMTQQREQHNSKNDIITTSLPASDARALPKVGPGPRNNHSVMVVGLVALLGLVCIVGLLGLVGIAGTAGLVVSVVLMVVMVAPACGTAPPFWRRGWSHPHR
jgi:hypothetical protein